MTMTVISLYTGLMAGIIVSGWGLVYPWGRLFRAVAMTARVESNWNPEAVGDAGTSLGLLQYNVTNARWIGGTWPDRALSPFWNGFLVPSYLVQKDGRITALRWGDEGLAAWRSLWVRGRAFADRRDMQDVGPIAIKAWADYVWLAGVGYALQLAALIMTLILAPVAVPGVVIWVVVGWLRA